MNARLTDRELDNVLDAWLDEGPATVSSVALAEVLGRIPTTRRRRATGRWLGPLAEVRRAERWRPAVRVASILVVLAALVGVVALAALIGAPPNPNPSPTPAQTPLHPSVELQLDGSPLPASEWQFFGCPAVTLTDPDGDRVCRFSDTWHRLEIYGLFQQGLRPGVATTSAGSVWVHIWWYRGEIGDTLHTGDFESVAGECQLNLAALTATRADASIECLAVPGRFATTVGGPEQEATIDLHGSFSINPSVGAIEGF